MKTLRKQNFDRVGLFLDNASVFTQNTVWTNTPNTIKQIGVSERPGEVSLYLTIKGLTKDNFTVKLTGNILIITLERKHELVIASSWGRNPAHEKTERQGYTIFERSDVFLTGDNKKFLKSVHFANNELIVKIGQTKMEVNMQD